MIDAVHGRGLPEFAAVNGLDLEQHARAAGIDAGALGLLGHRISLAGFAEMLDRLAISSGDDCLGLRLGKAYRLGDAGVYGLALLNAPTLGDALACYEKYQHLIVDSPFHDVVRAGEEVAVSWRYWPIVPKVAQFADFKAVLFVRTLRAFLGQDWLPTRMQMVREAPRSPALHHEILSRRVEFRARMNCVAFPAQLLKVRASGGDQRLFDFLMRACQRESQQMKKSADLLDTVQEHIMAGLPTRAVSLPWLASRLNVAERTLQRRLRARNATMETLTEEIRRELSDRLLANRQVPIEEVSYLCGYASAPAYSRAAKRWYGKSPGARRKILQQSQN